MSTTAYRIDSQGRAVIDHIAGDYLDYTFDFTNWLASLGDALASAAVTVQSGAGLVLESSAISGGKVTAWISGGTVHQRACVTCRITTTAAPARTATDTIYLDVI